jgi:uncharacterized protein YeaO (DUF488 family)
LPLNVRVRRIYDESSPEDGTRVLVDRVWPRGLRKDAAAIDEWLKDVAPTTELRKWYGHDPARFGEFRRRYAAELTGAALARLRALAPDGTLTLLTATKDVEHSQAAVLAELLRGEDAEDAGGGEPACYAHLVCPECGAVVTEGHAKGCSQAGRG